MDKRLLRRQMHPVQVRELSSSAKELARASGREQIAVDAKTVGGSEYPSLPPIFLCSGESGASGVRGVRSVADDLSPSTHNGRKDAP
jgi:hypothetical protein